MGPPPTVPALLSPLNGAHIGTANTPSSLRPKFLWTPSSGGLGEITYELDSSTDPTFATGVTSATAISGAFYQPATALPISTVRPVGAQTYWRVRACASGSCSAYSSPPRYFQLGRPLKDINGDGFDDVIAAASDVGGTNDPIGQAVAYLGRTDPTTITGTPDATINPPAQEDGDGFGIAVATVDFNGDGFADVVTGSVGLNNEGEVHVFYGGSPFDAGAPPDTFTNPFSTPFGTQLGTALGVGDFDGDGFGDFLASAPYDSEGNASSGFVMVCFGRDNSTAGTPVTTTVQEGAEGDDFGLSVVGLGDVNGDRVDDFAVGSPGANAVYVYLGDPSRKFKQAPTTITIAGESIGHQLAAVGDVNGDGYADLGVVDGNGKIYVFYGSQSGIATTPGWTITGVAESPVSILGDCGTGYGIFAAGLSSISVFAGTPSPPVTSTVNQANGAFTFSLDEIGGDTWTGDLDGDGIPDLLTTRETGPNLSLLTYLSSKGTSSYPLGQQNPTGNGFTVDLATKLSPVFN